MKPLFYYADDDEDDRDFVKAALLELLPHARVETFSDGYSLLKKLSADATALLPNLLILDVNMPLKSGKEVLVELRSLPFLKNLNVVMFTNSSLPADRQFAEQYGASFLTKPIEFGQFKETAEYFATLIKATA